MFPTICTSEYEKMFRTMKILGSTKLAVFLSILAVSTLALSRPSSNVGNGVNLRHSLYRPLDTSLETFEQARKLGVMYVPA